MKMGIIAVFILCYFGICNASTSTLYLPFPNGVGYRCTQNSDDIPTHRSELTKFALDFALKEGSDVVAAESGVAYVFNDPQNSHYGGFGYHVKIQHDDTHYSIYAHLSKIVVTDGEKVIVGQKIGESGGARGKTGSGTSTNPHLHFSLHEGNAESDSVGKSVFLRVIAKDLYEGNGTQARSYSTSAQKSKSQFVCDSNESSADGEIYYSVTPDLSKWHCAILKYEMGEVCWQGGDRCENGSNHFLYSNSLVEMDHSSSNVACHSIYRYVQDNEELTFVNASIVASGRGGVVFPTDSPDPGLPDFI